jgi:preprotein translocase subunit SecD
MAKITIRLWILIIALILALLSISPSFEEGISIKSIDKDSSAYEAGLRTNMKLISVNGIKITEINDYTKAISEIFKDNSEKRVEFQTDVDNYIFLTDSAPDIVLKEIPKTKIKTGLDLSGGARALIKAENKSLTYDELNDLISLTESRLNAFGLTDIVIKSVRDLEGENFMLIEIAGATPADIKSLVGQQGKFEAKISNVTIFGSGKQDIADVCVNNAQCAGITSCSKSQSNEDYCNFAFTLYLTESAAKKQAEATRALTLDESQQYLSEKIYLYIDDVEVDSLLISSELQGQVTTQISIQGAGNGLTREEAFNDAKSSMKKLQTILRTGSLPYKLEIVKLDSLSPSLGKEFTSNLIYLGFLVFLIISSILFVKYRNIKITLSVILTMFSEALITLGIAALINHNLDAPSIAGLIVGMGTGVNDQILILDESTTKGNSSLKERIKRALFIIFGAFFTIVAAMIPLFWAGTGMLKGFALTTIIGVSVGVLITRPAFADIIRQIQGE